MKEQLLSQKLSHMKHAYQNASYRNQSLQQQRDISQQALADAEIQKAQQIDALIKSKLGDDWTIERIESVARAAVRAGIYELIARVDVPTSVIINEYIDATKAFFDDGTPAFVNGILDKIAKEKRS